jgi:hypothetical protein
VPRRRSPRCPTRGQRVALTGTLLENLLGELWSMFAVVFPGVLGSWDPVSRQFLLPIAATGSSSPAASTIAAAGRRVELTGAIVGAAAVARVEFAGAICEQRLQDDRDLSPDAAAQ